MSEELAGTLVQEGLPPTTADATVRFDQMAMGKVAFTCGICGRDQIIDMWLWDNMPICQTCRIILNKLISQDRDAENTKS
jgi:hypothetical protein